MGKSRTHHRNRNHPLYAAVDLGTNNCRLLVAKPAGARFHVVDSHSQIVRLGEGLTATNRLSDASMQRTFDALSVVRQKLKTRGVQHVRCIATEACRKAENGAEFIREVQARNKLSFKIVSAAEEARLAAIGCHDLLEPEAQLVMVLDIGGGSTEIAFIDLSSQTDRNIKTLVQNMPIRAWHSFPLGVVTLTEAYSETGEPERYSEMLAHAKDTFHKWKPGRAYAERLAHQNAYMIGTSGTVTCLAGVQFGLKKYRRDEVDGRWLTRAQTEDTITDFTARTYEERTQLPTVGTERAELMLAGCAILQAALTLWPSERLRVADRGLREGLLMSMIHGKRKPRKRKPKPPNPAQDGTKQEAAS